jgi:hypothetical protein
MAEQGGPDGGGGSSEAADVGAPADPLDLETATGEQVSQGDQGLKSSIVSSPYNPDKARDSARRFIAFSLLGLLAGTVLLSFIALSWSLGSKVDAETNFDHLIGLLTVIFGPIVTLVGSATGFYFGAQTASARHEREQSGPDQG